MAMVSMTREPPLCQRSPSAHEMMQEEPIPVWPFEQRSSRGYWFCAALQDRATSGAEGSRTLPVACVGGCPAPVPPTPFDNASGTIVSGSPAVAGAPSLTPAHNGELQVYFYGSQNFSAPVVTEPAAITSLANARSSKEGFTLAIGQLAAPFMGNASPTYNATSSGSGPVILSAQAVLLIP